MKKIYGFVFVFITSFLLSGMVGASSRVTMPSETLSFPVLGFVAAVMVKNSKLPLYSTVIGHGAGGVDDRKKGERAVKRSWASSEYSGTPYGNTPSGSKDSNGGGSDKGNDERGGGGGYPPDDEVDEEAASYYENLKKAMAAELQAISTLLRQKNKLRLVLAMDIDKTLVWYPGSRSRTEEEIQQLMKLQQNWLVQFDEFYRANRNQIILVYNTARSRPVEPGDTKGICYRKGIELSNEIAISLDKTAEREGSTAFLKVPLNNAPSQHLLLPLPDALITGAGSYVEVNEGWGSKISNNGGKTPGDIIQRVNGALAQWRAEDFKDTETAENLLRFKENNFEKFRGNLQGTYILAIGNDKAVPDVAEQRIEMSLAGNGKTQVITTTYESAKHKKIFLHNNSVNKGSTLRILLNIMSLSRDSDEPEPKVVIFGDGMTDLPALRPDKEGNALNLVLEGSMEVKNKRLQSLGIDTDSSNLTSNWLASIVPDKKVFFLSNNPVVIEAINHHKVLKTQTEGALGLMKVLRTVVEECSEQVTD